MAIDYLNIPNGVHKIFNQTNNDVLGAMEQLNESISKIGIDFKKITYQNKKELKESQNLLKEFEKFVKSQNVDNEKDISKMSFNFAKEFTDEWERSYGGKINESTLKTLNSIASDMLELKKEAKKSYGKGFQSTSKYKEELNAFRTQSAVKLKNAKKEDEKKSEENIHITENNYIETDEIESTLNDINKNIEKLNNESFKKFGENFEQNEEYQSQLQEYIKQSNLKLFKLDIEKQKEQYEKSHITDDGYYEKSNLKSTQQSFIKNVNDLKTEAFEKFGENFEQNEEYQKQFKKLFLQNQIKTLKSYQKDKEEQYEKSHIVDNDYVEDIIEKTNHSVLKNLENLKIEAFEKFGENFEQNEKYQSQLIQLQKKSLSEIFDAQLEKEEKLYKESHLTENKYREDTHLEETERSILKDITKLNQEAFLKYGENFEQNEDYQKNYKSLINKATKDRIDAKQEDWDSRDNLFHDSVEKLKEVIVDQKKSLMGFLGPLNLIISPMQEFFGGSLTKYLFGNIKKGISTPVTEKQVAKLEDGSGFLYLGKKIEELIPNNNTQNLLTNDINEPNLLTNDINLLTNNVNEPNLLTNDVNKSNLLTNDVSTLDRMEFTQDDANVTNSTLQTPSFLGGNTMKFWNKKSKKRPTGADLSNLGGIGAIGLYLGNILENNSDDKSKDGGLGNLAKMGGLAKGFGIGAIIASVVWMIIDGISAMFKEEWGGNKVSRFAAGVLAGTDKGVKGALKNGGKWALMGAGIGTLIAPGLGTLIGGVIGLVIGGILGAIGGKRLNKFFVKIGEWFSEKLIPKIKEIFNGIKKIFNWVKEKVISPIVDTFSKIISIWKGEGSWNEKLLKTFGEIKDVVFNIFNNIKDAIWNHLSKPIQNELLKLKERFVDPLVNTFSNIINIFKSDGNIWEKIGNVFKEFFNLGKTLLKSITDTILESIKSIVNLFKFVGTLDFLHSPIESAKSIFEYLKNGGNNVEIDDDSIEPKKTKKTKDGIFSSNNSNQYLIRGNEKVQLDPQDNILVTTNPLGETKSYSRGELNPIINNVSDVSNSLSKTSKSEFSKVEQEIKKQNTIHNKSNTISNVTNNNSTNNSNYKNQLSDIVELLSKILDESKNKIQMPSVTRNDLLQVMGGYF